MNLTAEQVKKELYKTKVDAVFSHYVSGNLYYTVMLNDNNGIPLSLYQFPIETVDGSEWNDKGDQVLKLSEDLGTTQFTNTMRASELNRWIAKAIEKGEFIKVA